MALDVACPRDFHPPSLALPADHDDHRDAPTGDPPTRPPLFERRCPPDPCSEAAWEHRCPSFRPRCSPRSVVRADGGNACWALGRVFEPSLDPHSTSPQQTTARNKTTPSTTSKSPRPKTPIVRQCDPVAAPPACHLSHVVCSWKEGQGLQGQILGIQILGIRRGSVGR